MPAKLTDLLIDSNAMGCTTLRWALRYPAPTADAAAELIRLDEHSLRAAGIARFNTSP